ncbi:ATP-dependent DNA helicase RecG [Methylomonas sp. EFPC3]|uniref:ATP-dependent DNA helicase RecG n=1 Tax=Methylomonas sp. EFPC3 TaxID=3021710 RepID=UPI0024179523|nr:ATP-dependent DNA helicase RecG [Methylomonas sp. EFPC3]WFP50795.1 ATP-dependent DNA helicase RecG [Methylomonas sp. EFPC3]
MRSEPQQHPDPRLLPVTALNGIGAQSAARLEKLGIRHVQDLLFHLPLRYQDRSRITPLNQLLPGMTALVCGRVEFTDQIQRGRNSVICRIADGSGELSLRFFHFSVQQSQQLKPGVQIGCFGEIRYGFAGLEMVHPEYRLVDDPAQLIEQTLTPVYPLTEGVSQSALRKAARQALSLCLHSRDAIKDWLPAELLQSRDYPSLQDALRTLHTPPPQLSAQILSGTPLPALRRLAFEEFLAHHLALLQGKLAYKQWPAPTLSLDAQTKQAFLAVLPFRLTAAQQRVVAEIEADCRQNRPMLRLVQGDVGSGKTVVAALAALAALASGYQTAIMAPTELLAEQHFRNFSHWFADLPTRVLFLSGQLKGKARQQTLQALADGSAGIVIGTHALFQDSVHFHKLGLIVIDEQHRFGVHQRLALREKGQTGGLRPHQLIMTATPIPRTLAMLQYSDLDISVIDELPPGRKPVATSAISSERRADVIGRIEHWVAQQRQAYWVCTLIEESEALQCEAAEKTAAALREALSKVRIGLVHGRLKAAEKDAVMQAFKNRECDLLVATTVIEVGVDVPNAGLMVIENPERLGLSQLHQLRGRVGRGNQDSYCLLLYQAPLSQTGKQRLAILKQSNDGFVIAEKDLELRGPGEVMGTRQTGQIQFKIADLERDRELLESIPAAAQTIVQHHPEIIQPLIDRWIGRSRHYAEV